MNGHRLDINTRKMEKPLAAHFNQRDHSLEDLEVMGIKKIHNYNAEWRKLRERYWIFELRALTPKRLNIDD